MDVCVFVQMYMNACSNRGLYYVLCANDSSHFPNRILELSYQVGSLI